MSNSIIPINPRLGQVGGAGGGEIRAAGAAPQLVSFHRTELGPILSIYGRMVAAGQWRDYAIDHLREVAVVSVFRRASEAPLYRIEKRPKLAQRQGAYAVLTGEGRVLKRGRELTSVLRVFDAKLMRVVDRD
ncbi:MAG: DUF2794 domain-containing protein [Pseudomonadota bacterium]